MSGRAGNPQRTYSRKNRRSSVGLILGDSSPSSSQQSSQEDGMSPCMKKGDCSYDSDGTASLWDLDMSFDDPPAEFTRKKLKIANMEASSPQPTMKDDTRTAPSIKRRNSWVAPTQPEKKKKRTLSLPKIVITGPKKAPKNQSQKRKRPIEREKSKNSFELQVCEQRCML